jgi:anti-sigma factor RsiW
LANCEAYWDLISASLDGVLTPEEQSRLDAHLAQCPDCTALWEQLSGLEAELMELETPSEGFVDRVMEQVQTQEQAIPFTNLPQNRRAGDAARKQLSAWWKPMRTVGALVACCLLILGVGKVVTSIASFGSNSTGAVMMDQTTDETAQTPPESAESCDVAPEDVAPDATAGAAIAESDGAVSSEQAPPETLTLGEETFAFVAVEQLLPEGFVEVDDTGAAAADDTYYQNPDQPDVCYVALSEGFARYERIP